MSGSFKLNCRTKQLYSGGGTAFESSQKLRIDTQKTGLVSAPWLRLLSKPKGTPPRSPSVTSSRFLSARGLVGVFPLPKELDTILLCPVHKSEDFSTIECGWLGFSRSLPDMYICTLFSSLPDHSFSWVCRTSHSDLSRCNLFREHHTSRLLATVHPQRGNNKQPPDSEYPEYKDHFCCRQPAARTVFKLEIQQINVFFTGFSF